MGKAKENAKRVFILLAAAGFVLSSGVLTILAVVESNNNSSSTSLEQQLADAAQQQGQTAKEPLEGFSAEPFDAASVTELKVETLVQGEGAVATAESTVTANYFGWTSDGKIFDSTNRDGTTTPIPFGLNQVISGWTQGLTGVKQGSTVKLTIPADMAYGSVDNGDGRPVGPLVFIVELKEVQ